MGVGSGRCLHGRGAALEPPSRVGGPSTVGAVEGHTRWASVSPFLGSLTGLVNPELLFSFSRRWGADRRPGGADLCPAPGACCS